MKKSGRKPLLNEEDLENGGKIKLSVKQSAYGYQYAYALRKRTGNENIYYDMQTRELYKVEL